MPIPVLDGILNALPPHLGDPRVPSDLSPYRCTAEEVCARFATSTKRKEILEGFLRLRAEMLSLGIRGFQWLDGSFLEDIETLESREPRDIDVVTFVGNPADPHALDACLASRRDLLRHTYVKTTYLIDHYLVPLGCDPALLVENTRYCYGLFSHRRDRVWKGMLLVDLEANGDDDAARQALGGMP